MLDGEQELVTGLVSQVVVDLSYRNFGEPAFQTSLTFSLPDVFINPTVTPRDVCLYCDHSEYLILLSHHRQLFITCLRGISVDGVFNYTCVGFPDPIEMSQMV